MITGQNIMITGGAGFIGTKLTELLEGNNNIVLYDNLLRNSMQYTNIKGSKNVTFIKGDILDYDLLNKSMKNMDYVIHAAAIAGVDAVIKEPVNTMNVNMVGTVNVYKAALQNHVSKRIIDFSTSEVFGSMAYNVSENSNTISGSAGEARWVYAVSKLAGEHLAMAYYKQYNLPISIIRPFNVYGIGQTGGSAVLKFIKKALNNEPITIYGDGTQIRAWCYVDDFVRGTMMMLEDNNAIGETFNIGNSREVITIYSLAQMVRRILGSKSQIVFQEQLSADVELRVPNTKKATDILGFTAQIDMEEGVQKTANWLQHTWKGE